MSALDMSPLLAVDDAVYGLNRDAVLGCQGVALLAGSPSRPNGQNPRLVQNRHGVAAAPILSEHSGGMEDVLALGDPLKVGGSSVGSDPVNVVRNLPRLGLPIERLCDQAMHERVKPAPVRSENPHLAVALPPDCAGQDTPASVQAPNVGRVVVPNGALAGRAVLASEGGDHSPVFHSPEYNIPDME